MRDWRWSYIRKDIQILTSCTALSCKAMMTTGKEWVPSRQFNVLGICKCGSDLTGPGDLWICCFSCDFQLATLAFFQHGQNRQRSTAAEKKKSRWILTVDRGPSGPQNFTNISCNSCVPFHWFYETVARVFLSLFSIGVVTRAKQNSFTLSKSTRQIGQFSYFGHSLGPFWLCHGCLVYVIFCWMRIDILMTISTMDCAVFHSEILVSIYLSIYPSISRSIYLYIYVPTYLSMSSQNHCASKISPCV